MNDIDKIPVKCRDCPYWEIATYPWCCGDCKDIMNPKNGEYIKRIDAKRALTALSAYLDAETVQRCIEAMNNLKAALKAADVEPVRHGRWVKMTGMMPPEFTGHYSCSECDWFCKKHSIRETDFDFCPGCGAKMGVKE